MRAFALSAPLLLIARCLAAGDPGRPTQSNIIRIDNNDAIFADEFDSQARVRNIGRCT